MVDDLPHAAGPEARRRLARALGQLAATARFPVVVVAATEGGSQGGARGGGDLGGGSSFMQGGLHKVLLSSALFFCLHWTWRFEWYLLPASKSGAAVTGHKVMLLVVLLL